MSDIFKKIGSLKVKNGSYKDNEGVEKNRYHEVGVLLSSPHGSQLLIKLHATATTPPCLVSVFKDDGVDIQVNKEEVPQDIPDDSPTEDEIPF